MKFAVLLAALLGGPLGAQQCSFTLNPSTRSVPASPDFVGTFDVIASSSTCARTATSDSDWLTVSFGSPGTGNGTVGYRVAANRTASARSSAITVGNARFTVTQAGANCTIDLAPTSASVPATAGRASVRVSTACDWSASSAVPWLTITAGTTGSGNGVVDYSYSDNTGSSPRTGTLTIASRTFAVTQSGAGCTVRLSPLTAAFPGEGGTGSIAVTSTCAWTATTTANWISIVTGSTGSGNGTVSYRIAPNTGPSRTAAIQIGDQTFTVTQAPPCSVAISPTTATMPSTGGNGIINVSATCSWTASSTADWISILSGSSATGNATVSYSVTANPTNQTRTATIQIVTQTFTITQTAAPGPAITGITHAASFVKDLAAPGSVIAIFGSQLGPADITNAQLTPDGLFLTTLLAGTQVLVDSTPAPLVFTQDAVVAAVVPYNTSGKSSVKVTVTYQGKTSAAYTLPIQPVAPGLYTADASGSGQGAVFNQDLSYNSASNPAAVGSTIVLYGTGEGVTDPPGVDGKLNGLNPPAPAAPVSVTIGGLPATVTYKGGVYGVTPGLLQINAMVPLGATSGPAVPVVVTIGTTPSQPGVTVAIQ